MTVPCHSSEALRVPKLETESRRNVVRLGGQGKEDRLFSGYRVSDLQEEKSLELDGGDDCLAI